MAKPLHRDALCVETWPNGETERFAFFIGFSSVDSVIGDRTHIAGDHLRSCARGFGPHAGWKPLLFEAFWPWLCYNNLAGRIERTPPRPHGSLDQSYGLACTSGAVICQAVDDSGGDNSRSVRQVLPASTGARIPKAASHLPAVRARRPDKKRPANGSSVAGTARRASGTPQVMDIDIGDDIRGHLFYLRLRTSSATLCRAYGGAE